MFKKILLTSLLISTTIMADKNDIVKSLSPIFQGISIEDISKTDFKGVYEVINKNPIEAFYVSENGRYLIQGDVIDLLSRSRMRGSDKVSAFKKSLLAGIKEKDKIIFKADNEKHVVHVFTDVDCPFCRKLHFEMDNMNALGITVKYLAAPLASLHPAAQGKMEKIWCAEDRVQAMNDYKKTKKLPNVTACDNPVAEQLAISEQLGVNGTPAIFLENGRHIPGYMPAKKLLAEIQSTLGK
ncbi:Thiol:disulfide interchange protein DsbC [uncultured Candidatus Thioglobus sp.]|uniref:DsbC family protein n=1 Tax=Bathymodiolus heckerae thiotrophic gill symbiont TaxID=1052212 RepID=UPI0010B872A8|nr:DsbC family protein [Bathymodiolus heckerae thiotrophic gill symbiont]CAC9542029.1 Thiol:disulfide interchange protein DsbC [uncultured Gammaproteobacteria bacterium]CAC9594649.1 Thiol:disulfide interchange protein DsbC [uncultured Gammaproteobacteria bacterium]SHN89790.1 Thiol:disulfide interchange protein DsbC [Bathymodiolus heckerae thiotrophic gill symbiont]SMN16616.1 Thiol:disulfide interchange protein DsbC [uncultured Candidatus Thioglobus sp.]